MNGSVSYTFRPSSPPSYSRKVNAGVYRLFFFFLFLFCFVLNIKHRLPHLLFIIFAEEFWRSRKTPRWVGDCWTALLTQGQQHLHCCALLRTPTFAHTHYLWSSTASHRGKKERMTDVALLPSPTCLRIMQTIHYAGFTRALIDIRFFFSFFSNLCDLDGVSSFATEILISLSYWTPLCSGFLNYTVVAHLFPNRRELYILLPCFFKFFMWLFINFILFRVYSNVIT